MTAPARNLRNTENTRHLCDLLQSLFAAELLRPSRELWLVSAWVSDISLLDNTGGQFSTLAPEWPRTRIRLTQMLLHLARRGCRVRVATSTAEHNRSFVDAIRQGFKSIDGDLRLYESATLHEKGLLGAGFYLAGSFNFTHFGISINEEVAHLHVDPAVVAEHRVMLVNRWAGQ